MTRLNRSHCVILNEVKNLGFRGKLLHCVQDDVNNAGYSREFFMQKADYLHANPVRKGLVADSVKWYYSSAASFAGQETGPLEIDWLEW